MVLPLASSDVGGDIMSSISLYGVKSYMQEKELLSVYELWSVDKTK